MHYNKKRVNSFSNFNFHPIILGKKGVTNAKTSKIYKSACLRCNKSKVYLKASKFYPKDYLCSFTSPSTLTFPCDMT